MEAITQRDLELGVYAQYALSHDSRASTSTGPHSCLQLCVHDYGPPEQVLGTDAHSHVRYGGGVQC